MVSYNWHRERVPSQFDVATSGFPCVLKLIYIMTWEKYRMVLYSLTKPGVSVTPNQT